MDSRWYSLVTAKTLFGPVGSDETRLIPYSDSAVRKKCVVRKLDFSAVRIFEVVRKFDFLVVRSFYKVLAQSCLVAPVAREVLEFVIS